MGVVTLAFVAFTTYFIGLNIQKQQEVRMKNRNRFFTHYVESALSETQGPALATNLSGVLGDSVIQNIEAVTDIQLFAAVLESNGTLSWVSLPKQVYQNPMALSKLKLMMTLFGKEETFIRVVALEKGAYKVLFQRIPDHPNVFLVQLAPAQPFTVPKVKVVSLGVGVMALITAIILLMYALIVRKLTSSLDILSWVAGRVATGDLEQRIFVNSKDEIGELSYIFNGMVANLKTSSENLLHEKRRSEAIIASIPEGIIVTDMANRLILANKKIESILNASLDNIQGKILLEYLNNEQLVAILREKFQAGKSTITREISLPTIGDKPRIYNLTSTLVKNDQNESIAVVTILRDITHDREVEELREAFLRAVSHELRTPLTSIVGFIELLSQGKAGALTDQQQEYLRIVFNEANSLKNLIDDLLDLTRIKAGKMKLIYEPFTVKRMIDTLVTTFSTLAKAKRLELVSACQDETLEMVADAPKLRRILANLLSNAIKFTEKGSITIGCVDLGTDVEFYVEDTGIGLLEEERELIFEKFRQVDYSSTRKYDGIGLGLSIVNQMVEMHQGKVRVDSEYGKGSIFYVRIPKKPTT